MRRMIYRGWPVAVARDGTAGTPCAAPGPRPASTLSGTGNRLVSTLPGIVPSILPGSAAAIGAIKTAIKEANIREGLFVMVVARFGMVLLFSRRDTPRSRGNPGW